jgi:HD superfamily phosphodiesterase
MAGRGARSVGLKDLHDELARLHRICIDTAVFAYHLAEHLRYVAYTSAILGAVKAQPDAKPVFL